MSDGQRETRSDGNRMGLKKKVCPPTLCTAKLAPAADDGLLLVLVGRSNIVKVSKFQNEFMKSSFLPKYEPNIVRISDL